MKPTLPISARRNNNIIRTITLVYEFCQKEHKESTAVFTISSKDREVDGKYLLSLHRLFVDAGDPTGYKFAMKVFGEWEPWDRMRGNKQFKPYIAEWMRELEVKLRSDAIGEIIKNSKEGTKGQAAAKFLADGSWDLTSTPQEKRKKLKDQTPDIKDELSEIEASLGFSESNVH